MRINNILSYPLIYSSPLGLNIELGHSEITVHPETATFNSYELLNLNVCN